MNLLKAILLSAALQFASVSHADLSDFGTFTHDSVTSLDWLDVPITGGLSFNQVNSNFGGFIDAGWRYATGAEVDDLLARYVNPIEGLGQLGDPANGVLFMSSFEVPSVFRLPKGGFHATCFS